METTSNNRILKDLTDNKANIPEGIGVADDSGFASIAGSIADGPSTDDNDGLSIASDVKFRSINIEELSVPRPAKRKLADSVIQAQEAKKKADKEFLEQKREQTYKRLMHLLSKSKFYSDYICRKISINVEEKTTSKKKGVKAKRNVADSSIDENSNPPKRSQRTPVANKKYDAERYVSNDTKKKLAEQKNKMNLSQEDIEAALNQNFDNEEQSLEADCPDEFQKPKYFDGDLRDYQKVGLNWLKVLYENGFNGILGDEMGLGKTVQVIALFAHLLEKRQDGPYLIIAPLSTIPNWIMEFEKFAPQLPVVLFHGSPAARAAAAKKIKRKQRVSEDYTTYPVVLSTFEVPLKEKIFFRGFKWRYIVVDEGHRIKNHECQLARILREIESMNRLLLTGTPLQNNLAELWSLLNFLIPEIFDDLAVFESWFDAKELQEDDGTQKVLKQEEEKQVLSTLREILKPFMLRRVKDEVCLDIPPKKEMIVYAPMTELQHDLYAAVLNKDLGKLSRIEQKPDESEEPVRRKRKCTLSNKKYYADTQNNAAANDSRSSTPTSENNDTFDWNSYHEQSLVNHSLDRSAIDENLNMWRQYADINGRNHDFFVRLRLGTNAAMYRQIVNHPFLLHCPLDDAGLPAISEEMVKASGKLLVLDAMLKKLKANGHKVLVFSTSVMLLELIADYLTMRPWRFAMLTGKDRIEDRQESIKQFNSDPDMFLFLISTKAGGVGLNLTAADTVIMYDSDWNPQVDIQAMARCHRIGQNRPVVIYRLCTKGTIDERVMSRAEAKRKLEKMVISKKADIDLNDGVSLAELKRLLESSEHVMVAAEKEVYTEAELDKILDRSDLVRSEAKEKKTIKTEESDAA